MKALVSIHDVMPETFNKVLQIIKWLKEKGVPPCALLVVPGKNWNEDMISQLRALTREGYPLVAHGWFHKTKPKRLFHKLHSLILSRDVAEHLDLDSSGIIELMNRAHNWFPENNLRSPKLYVPPAWALGFLNQSALSETPYEMVEITRGVLNLKGEQSPKLITLPVTGYEADNATRTLFLRIWNQLQEKHARFHKTPLRISIHPNDLNLNIADQLEAQIDRADSFIQYQDIQQ